MNQWKFEECYNLALRYKGFEEVHTTMVWTSSAEEAGKNIAYDEELVGVSLNTEARKYANLIRGVWHNNNPLVMESGWQFESLRNAYLSGPQSLPGVYTMVRVASKTTGHLGKEIETMRIDMILPESCTAERDIREFGKDACDRLWEGRVKMPPFIEVYRKDGFVSVVWYNNLS